MPESTTATRRTDEFIIKKSLKNDFGRDVVRMHWSHRPFATRYDIVRISHEGKYVYAPILGLRGDEKRGIAHIGYDLRKRLGLPDEATDGDRHFKLTIEKARLFGQLQWYLCTKDPAVKIPAWLAAWSLVLGALSLILSVVSMLM